MGEKCAGNLSRNQGSSSKRFGAHPTNAFQNEIRTADATGLDVWYLKKKERNKEKENKQKETKRTRLVLKHRLQSRVILVLINPYISTHDALAWNPVPCCISWRQNNYFSLIASSLVRNNISFSKNSWTFELCLPIQRCTKKWSSFCACQKIQIALVPIQRKIKFNVGPCDFAPKDYNLLPSFPGYKIAQLLICLPIQRWTKKWSSFCACQKIQIALVPIQRKIEFNVGPCDFAPKDYNLLPSFPGYKIAQLLILL